MRSSRLVVAVGAAIAFAATGVPALAGAADAAGTTSVTVYLRPADGAALTRLARTPVTDRARRLAQLEKALPSAAAHRAAAAALEARGLAVTGESSWSVTATGPKTLVSSVFGAVQGLLPHLPAGLGSIATAALGAGGPRVVAPHAMSGVDFRNAYTSPANTGAGVLPYTGRDRVHRLTIATIQFSGWNRSDLAVYAHRHGLPYSSSTLTQVPAGQASVPTASDNGGAVEVALDQESLLSTAPYAHQRAFFAPNTDAGFAAAFTQVLDDALANGHAHNGGDRHIAALSISWGGCESSVSASLRSAVNNTLKSIVAAGVTVFASSGDAGAYDCQGGGLLGGLFGGGGSGKAVDFPAASPYVVGVGGTTLTSTRRTANTGGNWHESAWSCTSNSDCNGGGILGLGGSGRGGSGGGDSSVFAKPGYQSSISGGMRMVPDIAGDADPATGFVLYTSQGGGTFQVGGTSLAAPVSAALFTNMLASRGLAHGIGDIHGKLYSAPRRSFRDVTSGTNGEYNAGYGYDRVTGLGGPLWPAIGNHIFSGKRPKAHASLTRPRPRSATHWRAVRLHWGAWVPKGTKRLTAEVIVRRKGHGVVIRRAAVRPRGALTFTGARGATYVVTVQVANTRHRMSAPVHAKVHVPRHR